MIFLFILTDGKNYVMGNPMKVGEYLATTSPLMAKQFTYKQARSLVQRGGKRYSWIKQYQLVDCTTGKESNNSINYKGNANVYMDNNEFDYSILDDILNESNSILGLVGWDLEQLNTYYNLLSSELSRCDSAESDIEHALQFYKESSGGKRAQAHKMAKICYMLDDIRDRHKRIKQCMSYISVMQDAIKEQYNISKIKLELSKVKHSEYKGRTKYYKMALDILGGREE
jgi:hypothetical protein|nr:MAG TPA: hypothetical protein [Caudoviricetes sp.]